MDKQRANAFMLKIVTDVGTALAGVLAVVGDRTGLFTALAGAGPLTPADLAQRAAVAERYAQEWLAVMAGAGYIEYDASTGSFTLPDEHAMFLSHPGAETYLGGLFQGLPSMGSVIPQLSAAFKSGEGISFAELGSELPQALAAMNRSVYESRLVRSWLPAMPDVVARLQAGGRALDIGCGIGVVPMAMARGFPQATVWGIDLDERSIALGQAEAANAGLGPRLSLQAMAVEAVPLEPGWDFISTFDVIHDLPDPLAALKHIRRALTPGGTYLMVEPKVADALQDNLANPFARMLYGMSCLHCVPQSLSQGGPGLGACWGPARARDLTRRAGFTRFEALDIRSPALAFYALS